MSSVDVSNHDHGRKQQESHQWLKSRKAKLNIQLTNSER